MRHSFIFFLSLFLVACSTKKKHLFLPAEYQLNEQAKQQGKTMVYLDDNTIERSYKDIFYKESATNKYLVIVSYDNKGTSDSSIELNGLPFESYTRFGRLVKVKILKDTIVDDGSKLGVNLLDVYVPGDSAEHRIFEETTCLKDTIFNWKGKRISTLVLMHKFDWRLKDYGDHPDSVHFTFNARSYMAKGIGLIRYSVYNIIEKRVKTVDLIDIRDRINSKM